MSAIDDLKRLDNGHYVLHYVEFVIFSHGIECDRQMCFKTLEDARRCYYVMCDYYNKFDTINGILIIKKIKDKMLAVFDGDTFHCLNGPRLSINHVFSGNLNICTDDEIIHVIFKEPVRTLKNDFWMLNLCRCICCISDYTET